MKGNNNHHRRSRRLTCEPLESRLALSGLPSGFTNPAGLTLSFAPDGTKVQDQPSSLVATLAGKNGLTQWQADVARAFQTWAQYANLNVGIVPDGGQPLGLRGPTHSDPRFGDIRIAGVPLSADTTGEAIAEQRTIAGSWAGDVVLNMSAAWPTDARLFQVALHEAGHAFGLGHSADPNSPMFAHTGSPTSGPTATDIAQLQALYGPRRADIFEGSNGNDTVNRAARIPHAEAADGFDGTTPLVVYGDIQSAADKDVFLLPVLAGYHGPLTFQLWTAGISLLQGRISLLDKDGNVLDTAQSSSALGDVLTLHLPAASDAKYHVRIEPVTSDAFAAGAYGLVVKYDSLITVTAAAIQTAVLSGHQWESKTDDSAADVDLRKLLVSGAVKPLADDQHQDDSTASGKALTAVFDTAAVRKFQFVGTISDAADLDVYRLRSQSTPSATRGLTVAVQTLESSGLVPQLTILDKNGQILPTTIIANGDGLVMVRAANIVANQDYFVQIAGNGPAVGNYAVQASFDDVPIVRSLLTAGELSAAQPQQLATLYVARPQLFSFALASEPAVGASGEQTIWATVYDDQHRTVAFLGAAVGQFRSGDNVLLAPGTYHIRFDGRSAGGTLAAAAMFQFYADGISDPIGPPLVDPGTGGLFVCAPGSTSTFCYPGLPPTTDPFATANTTQSQNDPLTTVTAPPDIWFAPPDYLPTNPLNALDVSGDGATSPLDALIIINFLNAFGSISDPLAPTPHVYLDVDGDGFIAPLDVLWIFNELNAQPPIPAPLAGSGGEGEGEGEASPSPQIPIRPLALQSIINRLVDPIPFQLLAVDVVESVAPTRHR